MWYALIFNIINIENSRTKKFVIRQNFNVFKFCKLKRFKWNAEKASGKQQMYDE